MAIQVEAICLKATITQTDSWLGSLVCGCVMSKLSEKSPHQEGTWPPC